MKAKKIKGCLAILLILIFCLSTSAITAMEKDKIKPGLQGTEDQDVLELVAWKGVIANAETGESIEINSKDDAQLMHQSSKSHLIDANEATGAKEYYQETILSIPAENIDQLAHGTIVTSPMMDENNAISVVLGIYFSTGDSGIYRAFRIDGVYVDWQVTDPQVSLNDPEAGYFILNGIGATDGSVNELVMWDLESDANAFTTAKFSPSPWILSVNDFVYAKTIFSGNLTNANGETWSTVMEMDYN